MEDSSWEDVWASRFLRSTPGRRRQNQSKGRFLRHYRVTYYHGSPLVKHSLQLIPLTDSITGNVIYIYNWRGFLRQTFFSFDSAVSFYRHFYSVRAFSSTQHHWLRVYIHTIYPSTRLKISPGNFRRDLFLRRPYFAPFSVTFRSSYDCSLLHRAWCEYHLEPRKDTHLSIIYTRKTENNSTFATWKCIRCTIIIILSQRVYVYTHAIIYQKGKLVFFTQTASTPRLHFFFVNPHREAAR